MSRTDVHRPYWVLMQDPLVRHWFKDFHHHQHGICDLEHFLATAQGWYTPSSYYCHRQIWRQCPRLCGCTMCSGQEARKLMHKQERVAWRKTRQQLIKLGTTDLEDADVPPLQRSVW